MLLASKKFSVTTSQTSWYNQTQTLVEILGLLALSIGTNNYQNFKRFFYLNFSEVVKHQKLPIPHHNQVCNETAQESANSTVSNFSEEIRLLTELQKKLLALTPGRSKFGNCRISSLEGYLGPGQGRMGFNKKNT